MRLWCQSTTNSSYKWSAVFHCLCSACKLLVNNRREREIFLKSLSCAFLPDSHSSYSCCWWWVIPADVSLLAAWFIRYPSAAWSTILVLWHLETSCHRNCNSWPSLQYRKWNHGVSSPRQTSLLAFQAVEEGEGNSVIDTDYGKGSKRIIFYSVNLLGSRIAPYSLLHGSSI